MVPIGEADNLVVVLGEVEVYVPLEVLGADGRGGEQ